MRSKSKSQPDHGYAWVVLAATACMRMLLDGFWTSLGILFVKWEIDFDVSPADTSGIGSIFVLIIFGIAPVSSALAHRMTYRWVSVQGGVLIVVCLFAGSFVNQFWHLYIVMTFLSIGMGLSYQPAWSYFIYFFKKRFAMAHMISAASGGVGFLAFPPFLEYLISSYGWRGAFQITSAIMAHMSVCGVLLKEPQADETNEKKDAKLKDSINDKRTNACCAFLQDMASDLDLSLFRNVRVLFQAILNGFLYGAPQTSMIYLIPYAISVGVSPIRSSFLMIGFGGALVLVRISPIGWIVDKQYISASTVGGVMEISAGIIIIIIQLTTTYSYLMLLAVCFGLTHGLGGCMLFITVAKSPGYKDKGPAAKAWFQLFCGIGSLVFVYSFGYLIGSTGKYTSSMISCGLAVTTMGVVLLCDPCLIKWQKKRNNDATDDFINDQTFSNILRDDDKNEKHDPTAKTDVAVISTGKVNLTFVSD